MRFCKPIIVGVGLLVFLFGSLRPSSAAPERTDGHRGRPVIQNTHRGNHYDRHHQGHRVRVEHRGGHDRYYHRSRERHYHHSGGSYRFYGEHRHYVPTSHWRYYRHAGGAYAYDGTRWYFFNDGRWYYHLTPVWYEECRSTLIVEPFFPWTFSFTFPGYYDCR